MHLAGPMPAASFRFIGGSYDRCLECFSSDTEDVALKKTIGIGEKTDVFELGTSK